MTTIGDLSTRLKQDVNRWRMIELVAGQLIDAWDVLPGGRDYKAEVIARWLSADMAPAIDNMRTALGRQKR